MKILNGTENTYTKKFFICKSYFKIQIIELSSQYITVKYFYLDLSLTMMPYNKTALFLKVPGKKVLKRK